MSNKRDNLLQGIGNKAESHKPNTETVKVPDIPAGDVDSTVYGNGEPSNAVASQTALEQFQSDEGVQISKNVRATVKGLKLADAIGSEAEFEQVGSALLTLSTGFQWCLGDWLNEGDNFQWGETYEALAQRFDIAEKTISAYKMTAAKVPFRIRNANLSFSHHRLVKDMETETMMETWLKRADKNNWGVEEMRVVIAQTYPKKEKTTNTYTRFRQTFNDGIRDFRQAINSDKIEEAEYALREMEEVFNRMRTILDAAKPD